MELINLNTINKEILIEASQETAFKVFTEQMDLWWPRTHHVGNCPMRALVLEARPGGRWYSKHEDDSEADVGYVLTYQPFDLFVLAWQVNGDFKFDPELVTEVEVQFIPEGPKKTRVKLEHKDLQKLGGSKVIESMDEGWGQIMELYKTQAES
ncbi:MAG: ATPase [Mucilaginibacter sp.]|jgi:uncharacterized protein YndB with AHSA1/START domain|nr:ATPase [Mucilaginibacter sp.]